MNTRTRESAQRLEPPLPRELAEDTYFLDRDHAREVAARARLTRDGDSWRLQLCYHDGPPFPDGPVSLVSVPVGAFSELFGTSRLPLPARVQPPGGASASERDELERAFGEVLESLRRHRASSVREKQAPVGDAYFFDVRQAFVNAVQRRPVDLGHPTIRGVQVCYYDGPPIPGAPDNLVSVPCEAAGAFFAETRLRLPTTLVFPEGTLPAVREALADTFRLLLAQAQGERGRNAERRRRRCRGLAPRSSPTRLRVFFPASRVTQVMQYASRGLARAFERLGHEVRLSIEQSPLEQLDWFSFYEDYEGFAPDLVVSINHLNNEHLHPEMPNVVWYQDPMPPLLSAQPLDWRPRDLVYSVSEHLDPMIARCGATEVARQPFCVDGEVFRRRPEVRRETKIVFVGSSYAHKLNGDPRERRVLDRLAELLERGRPVGRADLERVAAEEAVGFDDLLWRLYAHAVRDTAVRWLCESGLPGIAVYGRGWEQDPVVAPWFRGEVPHGEALARIYNGASHALVPHPFDLNSQRIAEVDACGCIPVVYDCRALAEAPHWDEECLFFLGRQGLVEAARRSPRGDPGRIGRALSYDAFAERILARVAAL